MPADARRRRLRATLVWIIPLLVLVGCGGEPEEGEREPGGPPAVTAAADQLRVTDGTVRLDLDGATLEALRDEGVQVSPVPPAREREDAITWDVSFGTLRSDTLVGAIDLGQGGILFSRGDRHVDFRRMALATGDGALAASPPGVPLATLDLSDLRAVREDDQVTATGITASLDGGAAGIIRDRLDVDAPPVQAGRRLGDMTARVSVAPVDAP